MREARRARPGSPGERLGPAYKVLRRAYYNFCGIEEPQRCCIFGSPSNFNHPLKADKLNCLDHPGE